MSDKDGSFPGPVRFQGTYKSYAILKTNNNFLTQTQQQIPNPKLLLLKPNLCEIPNQAFEFSISNVPVMTHSKEVLTCFSIFYIFVIFLCCLKTHSSCTRPPFIHHGLIFRWYAFWDALTCTMKRNWNNGIFWFCAYFDCSNFIHLSEIITQDVTIRFKMYA